MVRPGGAVFGMRNPVPLQLTRDMQSQLKPWSRFPQAVWLVLGVSQRTMRITATTGAL